MAACGEMKSQYRAWSTWHTMERALYVTTMLPNPSPIIVFEPETAYALAMSSTEKWHVNMAHALGRH